MVITVETIAIGILCFLISLIATVEPSFGQSKRFLGIFIVRITRRTLIECHHDVGSDDALYLHHTFRSKQVLRAVDVATEGTSFFCNLAVFTQREYLEAARIGENRTIPSIELMQATCLLEHLKSWTKVEMIGIAKNNLCLDLLLQFAKMQALDTAHCAYRHENRSLDLAMVGGNLTGTRPTVLVCCL